MGFGAGTPTQIVPSSPPPILPRYTPQSEGLSHSLWPMNVHNPIQKAQNKTERMSSHDTLEVSGYKHCEELLSYFIQQKEGTRKAWDAEVSVQ